MTASTPPSHKPAPPVKDLDRQLRWPRLLALLFLVVGGFLLAANLHVLPPAAQRVVGWGWPALILAAGLWVLLASRSRPQLDEPTFVLDRADATAGELVVNPGAADLRVGSLPAGGVLAVGQLPAPRGPALARKGVVAQVRVTPDLALPLFTGPTWAIDLTPDVPWALQWQSSLGDVQLDLRDLSVATVDLRSAMGHVDLTLPVRGQAEIQVRLGLGNLTVRVPEAMAVKVKVNRGRLATVQPEARRFVELAPGEWSTPLFAVSPARCTLTVSLWSGDLTLV